MAARQSALAEIEGGEGETSRLSFGFRSLFGESS